MTRLNAERLSEITFETSNQLLKSKLDQRCFPDLEAKKQPFPTDNPPHQPSVERGGGVEVLEGYYGIFVFSCVLFSYQGEYLKVSSSAKSSSECCKCAKCR